jgi:hypothetical protein
VIARMLPNGSTVQIARALHLEQNPLYRRVNRIRHHLRQAIEAAGISADDVARLLGGDHD